MLKLDSLRLAASLLTGALIAAIMGLAAWTVNSAQVRVNAANQARAEMMSTAFAAYANATVRWLVALIDDLDQAWTPELNRFIADAERISLKNKDIVLQLAIVNPSGILAWSSISGTQSVDLSDRDHIKVHIAGNSDGLYISKPLVGRVSKRSSIQFTRAVRREGVLRGVIVVSVDTSYFSRFYSSLPMGKGDVISLVRSDGAILARSLDDAKFLGSTIVDAPYLKAQSNPQGWFRRLAVTDQVWRIYAWNKLAELGLVVTAGIDEEAALADFYLQRRWIFGAASALSLLLLLLATVTVRAFGYRKNLSDVLQNEKSSLEEAVALRTRELGQAVEEVNRAQAGLLRMAAVVKHSPDAVISTDSQGLVQTWNPAATLMFGYSEWEMLGKDIRRLFRAADVKSLDPEEWLLAKSSSPGPTQLFALSKSGNGLLIEVVSAPVRDEQGSILAFSLIIRDVTDRHRMEQILREKQKMEAIGQLTGGLAHDFNNLLGIVVGNLDMLGEQLPENDQLRRRHRVALEAALRGAEVTRSLLAVARRQPLKIEKRELNSMITEMLPLIKTSIGAAVKVETALYGSDLFAQVDPAGLSNALLNLVINARDAMKDNPGERLLELRLQRVSGTAAGLRTGDYALLEVSDNGKGMSAEVLERAFEPFFTTKEIGHGTGLGLSMVRGFCEQLGGTARINSTIVNGTTVSLYLPLDSD